ncbi:hypothetical protein HBI56_110070 [Parastagonospora nodorum]|uniref:Uncharacterized protein n=1 Tax=Phaeosphaeria nodorum (strain SN15 / ATCC MYA-4574 / FGSC 10173) TaxID=321614 RepID=A0A7U2EUA4_PHANO|nr:hypothetical protein HBH56_042610 [Parastagonospora nodorum]QRC92916.1 hypothetical protein JI435_403160 [Parastagonospora nodorum SN15]KAH3933034.1 hypothetical protein HBH54_070360 [Parastagonospora nodorum]KAH3943447.1 hypothetical protein HBH53_174540 [Parastagonospora nodorum]KAH3972993.1 hypothetical protein HBH52_142500 [Parastagonospora nodorum]
MCSVSQPCCLTASMAGCAFFSDVRKAQGGFSSEVKALLRLGRNDTFPSRRSRQVRPDLTERRPNGLAHSLC